MHLGPFEIVAPIGTGGIASVWRGVHRGSGLEVAVKVLTTTSAARPRVVEAMRSEVRAMAGLDHPNVVWVHDTGTAEAQVGPAPPGSPWYAMELARGGSPELSEVLRFEDLRALLLDVLAGLAHAHSRGVLHRDLKPENILYTDASRRRAQLSDFGMALLESRPEDALRGGTPTWMAPEQAQGHLHAQGPWTDLYSVGCVAWALACGRAPFTGSIQAVMRQQVIAERPPLQPRTPIPEGFAAWVGALMHREPERRYACAAHAAWALRELAATCPPPRARPPLSAPPRHIDRPARHVPGAGRALYGLRPLPVVGRLRHRAVLWDELGAAVAQGSPRVVVLRGPAGYGKSFLARWLCQWAHESGAAATFVARHNPHGGPHDGVVAMIARARRVGQVPPGCLLALLQADVDRAGAGDAEWEAAALCGVLRPGDAGAAEVRANRAALRHALVVRDLHRLRRGRPAVLWIDDAQWGIDSVKFSSWVRGDPGAGPLLFVLTVRDEDLAVRPDCARALDAICADATVLHVGPLDEEDRPRLVQRLLQLAPEVAAEVERRTGGNPLFATQLVGDWVQRGLLESTARGFALRTGAELPLPASLAETWLTRVDALLRGAPSSWRDALEVAATLGQEVDMAELQEVCLAAGLASARELAAALVTHDLATLDPSRVRMSFVHGMLREAISERAERGGRAQSWHAAAARALAERGPSGAVRRALHLEAAGRHGRAIDAWLEAGNWLFDFDRSQRAWAYDRALAALETWSAADDPRWAQASHGRFMEALFTERDPAAARALCSDERGGVAGRLQRQLDQAFLHAHRGELDAAEAEVVQVVRAAARHPLWRARADNVLASILIRRGRRAEAVAPLLDALAATPDRPELRVTYAARLVEVLAALGRHDEARDALGRLEDALGPNPPPGQLLERAQARAYAATARGALAEAIEAWEEARRGKVRCRQATCMEDMNLAILWLRLGALDAAAKALEASGYAERDAYWVWTGQTAALIHAALSDDWERFDAVPGMPGAFADDDLADLLVQAGIRASEAGFPERALRAWSLALPQLEHLGWREEARLLRGQMASVESTTGRSG